MNGGIDRLWLLIFVLGVAAVALGIWDWKVFTEYLDYEGKKGSEAGRVERETRIKEEVMQYELDILALREDIPPKLEANTVLSDLIEWTGALPAKYPRLANVPEHIIQWLAETPRGEKDDWKETVRLKLVMKDLRRDEVGMYLYMLEREKPFLRTMRIQVAQFSDEFPMKCNSVNVWLSHYEPPE